MEITFLDHFLRTFNDFHSSEIMSFVNFAHTKRKYYFTFDDALNKFFNNFFKNFSSVSSTTQGVKKKIQEASPPRYFSLKQTEALSGVI